jgi:hypothetical protein
VEQGQKEVIVLIDGLDLQEVDTQYHQEDWETSSYKYEYQDLVPIECESAGEGALKRSPSGICRVTKVDCGEGGWGSNGMNL